MMMLNRYIIKTVLLTTAVVILVMMALFFIINFLDELRDIGTGDYGFSSAVIHVLLGLPNNLYQFFPMIALLGGVIGLGILASHQELVVMRAAGFSVLRIATANLTAALVLIVIVTLAGEWIAPKAHQMAENQKQSAENGGQAIQTAAGIWIHEGNNFLNINQVMGLHHLKGVTRYEFDSQHHLLATYYVKSLDFESQQWLMRDAVKTTIANNQAHSEEITQGLWDLALNPQLLNVGLVEPAAMSLFQLNAYSRHLVENKLQATDFQFEFWKRIFQPLSTLVMILLALPFVFRSSRAVTMGWRVLLGISIGFIFYILNAFAGQFSVVFQFSPLFAALFPTLLCAIVGVSLALRLRL
ncbi:MAG: LPS export ABC transporter permease LptG [Gammaproteobacteria bacterium]|nr:LPS export ABC transporter permease LptG [Gammaproteobacteria bacterium]